MFTTFIQILSTVFVIALGAFILIFVGDLLLSLVSSNPKGIFFKRDKKSDTSLPRPIVLAPGQKLDLNKQNDATQTLNSNQSSSRTLKIDDLLGRSSSFQQKGAIDTQAAERERLEIEKKRMALGIVSDEDETEDEDEDIDDNDNDDIKNALVKHLEEDETENEESEDEESGKSLAQLEKEAIEEKKLKIEGISDTSKDETDDDDAQIDAFLNSKAKKDTGSKDNEKIKLDLELELEKLKAEKELLEQNKLIIAQSEQERQRAQMLKNELDKKKSLVLSEKERISIEIAKLAREKSALATSKKNSEAKINKQNAELKADVAKINELKAKLEEEMNNTQIQRKALEEERAKLEEEKQAILSKRTAADADDSSRLKAFASFTPEECEKRIATLTQQIKDNERELKRTRKEYIPLDKVRRTLENDKKKLRTKEAIVARKKVMLYGVNNYVDLDDARAKELSKELDLLEGLRLSVQNCEEVLQKNKDRLPILEANYKLLTQRDENLKEQLAQYERTLEAIKK